MVRRAPKVLPPAEEVVEDSYELRQLQAPVLRGFALRAFIYVYETFLGSYLYPRLAEKSGLSQVLYGITVPEHPQFLPDVTPMNDDPEPNTAYLDISKGPAASLEQALSSGLLPHTAQLHQEATTAAAAGEEAATQAAAAAGAGAGGSPSHAAVPCSSGGPTIVDYHRAYTSGACTPSEACTRIVAFIRASEGRKGGSCGWFVAWSEQEILRQAEESTQRFKRGCPRSLLEGVPFAVKDVVDALPYPTTAGTKFMASQRPATKDAPYVSALRSLGAILLGKTALHEIGMGITGLNLRTGTALNPHSLQHFCGGSSSGTAAVLAAGLCPIGIGSDGGGSIRIPSSFCGVVGLKPSAGRVSGVGCVEVDCTVATMGAQAGCVQDAALLHTLMAHYGCKGDDGHEPLLPSPALPSPWPVAAAWRAHGAAAAQPSLQPLAGLRIGIYHHWFDDSSPAVLPACRAALDLLVAAGACLVDVVLPELELLRVAHTITITSEMYHNFLARCQSGSLRGDFNSDVRLALANPRFWTPADYLQVQRIRARANTHFRRAFQKVDIICTPTTPVPAPRIHPAALSGGESNLSQVSVVMRFMVAANMLGLPAMSLPVGSSADAEHLPVALQLLGRPLADATLMRVGAVLEAALQTAAAAGGGGGGGDVGGSVWPGVCGRPAVYLNPLTGEQRGL